MKSENLEVLKNGGVGLVLTDTIFGLVGQALKPDTVERLYRIKGRAEKKPFIILISDIKDLGLFNVEITESQRSKLDLWWPGPVSVILTTEMNKFNYLHRGNYTLSFRIPAKPELLDVIKEVGPLVAPSANPQGFLPPQTIIDARRYFGNSVDFYEETSDVPSLDPSTLVKLSGDGSYEVLRSGGNFKL
ncbi:MAG: L-threonylcarbamoyladenylate synthase [Candidatus Staskawiczbacteria bacterium]